jgi:hypothetical protein
MLEAIKRRLREKAFGSLLARGERVKAADVEIVFLRPDAAGRSDLIDRIDQATALIQRAGTGGHELVQAATSMIALTPKRTVMESVSHRAVVIGEAYVLEGSAQTLACLLVYHAARVHQAMAEPRSSETDLDCAGLREELALLRGLGAGDELIGLRQRQMAEAGCR